VNRPFPALGIGWLIALVVLILCILNLIGGTHVPDIWLILGLALAILL
jgi:hypothetical protein